jgi:hypothetical protein
MGLLAMPSEGRHSRHSGASTAAIAAGPGPRHYQCRLRAGSDQSEYDPRRRRAGAGQSVQARLVLTRGEPGPPQPKLLEAQTRGVIALTGLARAVTLRTGLLLARNTGTTLISRDWRSRSWVFQVGPESETASDRYSPGATTGSHGGDVPPGWTVPGHG